MTLINSLLSYHCRGTIYNNWKVLGKRSGTHTVECMIKKLTRFYRFVSQEAKHVYGLITEGSSLNMSNVLGTHLLLSFYFSSFNAQKLETSPNLTDIRN